VARLYKYESAGDRITGEKPERLGLLGLIHLIGQLPDAHLACIASDQSWTIRQLQVLDQIDRSDAGSQSDLVPGTNIDRSTLSSLTSRLASRRLIVRRKSRRDRRVLRLHLTEEGAAVLVEGRKKLEEIEARILAPLSPDDRERFLVLLAAVVAEMPRPKTAATQGRDRHADSLR
jgi:DNA-binding MarR family transcriptional regulator